MTKGTQMKPVTQLSKAANIPISTPKTVPVWSSWFAVIVAIFLSFSSPIAAQAQELLHPFPGTPMAREFELPDLDGNKMKLSDFKGNVVVVNFWATWCPPCRAEIPSMQRAWDILKKHNVTLLAIHVGGNEDKIWSFLTDFNVDFPVLLDARSKVSRRWPMMGLPTTFIIDPQGKIALRAIGGREWDDPALIKSILALTKPK